MGTESTSYAGVGVEQSAGAAAGDGHPHVVVVRRQTLLDRSAGLR